MAEAKAKKSGDDAGVQEIQERVDKELEQGFIGAEDMDPIDNKEYSIVTGPDSPTIAEQAEAKAEFEAGRDLHPATKNAL